MRLSLTFASLFLSVILLQLSSGGVGPLDALSGIALGFSTSEIGLLGSAHFVGFFLGCWWTPRLLGSVGHARAFAALTALGGIGLLAHMLVIDAYAWAGMRVATGLCIAGCYTVVESWLQGAVKNAARGRSMGLYRGVDLGASLAAQLMIAVLEPASYVSYNLLALMCCASLLPLALTKGKPPATKAAPRLRPALAFQASPLAACAVVVAGLTGAAFRMVGPIYGDAVGLSAAQVGWFLAAFVAGGAVAQLPVGWLADRWDRRRVLVLLSALAIGGSGLMGVAGNFGATEVLAASALFGFITFPIYSVAAAHAHDFTDADQRVELSAALIFAFALGAISAPLGASKLIEAYGPEALFGLIASGHIALVLYGLIRMRARPTADVKTPYVYAPRTSFTIGRLTLWLRDKT